MEKGIDLRHFTQEPVMMEVEKVGFIRGYCENETAGLTDEEKENLIQTGIDDLKRKVADELIKKGYIKEETSEYNGKTIVTATIYIGKEETRQDDNVSFVSPKKMTIREK